MPFILFLLIFMGAIQPASALTTCTEEIERGVASWYGPNFSGALTQSEEPFDPSLMSAAHPNLPFGTVVKVTNMRNSRSVWVRINDRGGFGSERAIDLSEGAAEQIGMIDSGTAPVAIFKCH